MKIYSNANLIRKHRNCVLAIGNFDGLHLGHQKVILDGPNYKWQAVKFSFKVFSIYLASKLQDISDDIEVAIIGCYVNGPGESKASDIGLTGASPKNLMYINVEPSEKVSNESLVDRIESEVREQLNRNHNESDIIAKG